MAVKNFRFVSPGIFINEIDKSQLTREFPSVGPVVIGRTKKGPAMAPIQVDSFAEFQDIFGSPVSGGVGGDIWRNGNQTAPTYAAYAAQAWLRNATPLTFVRLLGTHHPDRDPTGAKSLAGWDVGAAFGLFVAERPIVGSLDARNAALAAVIYNDSGEDIGLAGAPAAEFDKAGASAASWKNPVEDDGGKLYCTGQWVKSVDADYGFTVHVGGVDRTFNFNSKSEKFIRNVLNTNPTLLNTNITTTASLETYFLGETYERHLTDMLANAGSANGAAMAVLLPLADSSGEVFDKNSMNIEAQEPTTPWIFSQDSGARTKHEINDTNGTYKTVTNLFRLAGIGDGVWSSTNLKVAIEDIRPSEDDRYGTFTVALREVSDSDKSPVYVERFANCNLNPNSSDYVARKIGNMESIWDYSESKYITNGDYPNISRSVRVIMNEEMGNAQKLVPFGFYGPATPRAIKCRDHDEDFIPADLGGTTGTSSVSSMAMVLDQGTNFTIAAATKSPALGCPTNTGCTAVSMTLVFPAMSTRNSSTDYSLFSGTQASFGVTSNQKASSNEEYAYADMVKPYSEGFSNGEVIATKVGGVDKVDTFPALSASVYNDASDHFFSATATQEIAIRKAAGDFYNAGIVAAFTLDDLVLDDLNIGGSEYTKNKKSATWAPGSRFHGASISVRGAEATGYGGTSGRITLTANDLDGESGDLSLMDVARANAETPTSLSFSFGLGTATHDGTIDSNDKVTVDLGPTASGTTGYIGSLQAKLDRLVQAINGVNVIQANIDGSISLDITATRTSSNTIELVQDVVGSDGNTAVAQASPTGFTFTSPASFAGGEDIILEENITPTPSYKDVLDLGFDKFTVPLFGGFDGFDITEKEPFRNEFLSQGGSETTNYAFSSIKRAINTITDPEVVEMNLATIPGCTNSSLTDHLISVCEERGDSLAIIDLEGDYVPNTENIKTSIERVSNVKNAVDNLKARGINSSYGCTYFPWVQIRDAAADSFLWAPPSVVALGTMASSERKSELWFAPAGFKRGGLTEGSAGIPVTQTRLKLTSKDRDKLYEANINPIASFPSEGIVIFGQKTLQVTSSALDRINVRRLLIFLKKEVSRIATGVLFDNNVPATWQRFTSKVEPFLSSVKSRFGLSDFKVILDETTTTPDLIDRNILYAKVLLKPARAIEFIAIDFVISKTGASFDD